MNMKINRPCRRLIALVVSLCPLLAYAQHAYTLDECLELALKNNVRIRNADNDLNAAKLQKKAAFTNYFPTVSAAGGGFRADGRHKNEKTGKSKKNRTLHDAS